MFTANCNFAGDLTHVYFDGVACLEMPHILHMAVAVVTAAVFFCVTALMSEREVAAGLTAAAAV